MRLYSLPSVLDTPSPLNPQGKHQRYFLARRLDGTQTLTTAGNGNMSAIVYQRIHLLSDTALQPYHPETSAVYGIECCGTNCETKRAMHCTCLSCHCIACYEQSNQHTQHHVGAVRSPGLQGTTARQSIPCASRPTSLQFSKSTYTISTANVV